MKQIEVAICESGELSLHTNTKNERRANFSKFRQIPKTPGTGNRESEDIHSVTRSSWIWDWVQFHSGGCAAAINLGHKPLSPKKFLGRFSVVQHNSVSSRLSSKFCWGAADILMRGRGCTIKDGLPSQSNLHMDQLFIMLVPDCDCVHLFPMN